VEFEELWEIRVTAYLRSTAGYADQGGMSKVPVADGRLPGADPATDIHRHFWLRHIRTGFGVLLGETLVVMVYLAVTPRGPHRPVLWVVTVSWLICAVISLLFAPYLAARPWRAHFSATWTILSAFAVAGVASLDGGMSSPIIFLLFLPIANAALAFTPLVAAGCGLATLASAGFLEVTDAHARFSDHGSLVLFGVLAGVSALSVAASLNRIERERRERELNEQVALLAATDGLTGCAVRRVFYERLEEEIARSLRNGHSLSLMLIDVDSFKAVNDTFGHLVGDHVLAAIGGALRIHSRSFDVVGRLGGDEFAVLMPDTDASAAATLAERVRLESSAGSEVPVTLSIGVGELDRSIPTAEHIFDDADFALYQVKRGGRDGVALRRCGSPVGAGDDSPARSARSARL
jgi:diguanylate cyclase (GGDEF)-like protein